MKHIIKNQESQDFVDWKNKDKMYLGGNPKWSRVPKTIRIGLKTALLEEQGYICCYCERAIRSSNSHIEHLKPKSAAKYPKLQLDYENLLCSCQLEIEKGKPRHCGNEKGSWYSDELFVKPVDAQCEAKFKYTYDGHILPFDASDNAANTTIKKLSLDIDKLNDLRKKTIEPFLDPELTPEELDSFVEYYLEDKKKNNGKFNEFYTTIKFLFATKI